MVEEEGGEDEDVQLDQDNLDFNELMTIKMLMVNEEDKKDNNKL